MAGKVIPFKLPWGAYIEFPSSLGKIQIGKGTPQSAVSGRIGDLYLQTDAADADHVLWYKTTGTFSSPSNTGWQNHTVNALAPGTSITIPGTGILEAGVGAKKLAIVPLGTVNTAGGVFSWANPEAGSIMVTGLWVDVTTGITTIGLDAGTTASSGTTNSTNLMSNVDIHVAGEYTCSAPKALKLASGKWVTGSDHGAGDTLTGLVGNAYIEYFLI